MGRQRRLKQKRRNNERAEAEFGILPTIEFMLNEDMNLDQPEDFTEADVILKRLMPMLPSFLGKNFELWAIKIEGLLGSVDLWKFVQETHMNSENKSRRAIALFLIISALDENILSSILNEFGEVFDRKMFWHILEMRYSMKWSEKSEVNEIVIKNSDCVESIITGIKSESMAVDDNKVACDSHEIPCDAKTCEVKYETCEVKYDENYASHEEWLCLMHEKQLIDELLFGERICLSSYANQKQDDMFATMELIKEVELMNQPTMKDEKDYIIGHDSKYNGEFVKLGCTLYKALSHGKREEHEFGFPWGCCFKEVIRKSRKEKLHHYLMVRRVKMKLRLHINKYGPFRKKTKMKVLLSYTIVSLAETKTSRHVN